MLDKTLIEKKFQNSLNCYDKNAIIQDLMAKKLISLIPEKKYENILEIGTYSGLLTKRAIDKFEFEKYFALDIVDSFSKIKDLSNKIEFLQIDVEKFKTDEKFDLILANASLQWCNDFKGTINKLKSFLKKDGIIAITTFAADNFYEIKETFNVSLDYKEISELEKIFSLKAKIFQEIHTLQFSSPLELLKHLKLTGVNAISKNNYSVSYLKKSLDILNGEFQNKLTYKPVYIVDFSN